MTHTQTSLYGADAHLQRSPTVHQGEVGGQDGGLDLYCPRCRAQGQLLYVKAQVLFSDEHTPHFKWYSCHEQQNIPVPAVLLLL